MENDLKLLTELYDVLTKNMDEATRWVNDLTIYKCPSCGEETIFKSGCPDCEESGHE